MYISIYTHRRFTFPGSAFSQKRVNETEVELAVAVVSVALVVLDVIEVEVLVVTFEALLSTGLQLGHPERIKPPVSFCWT